jgi:hypothetical protein
MSTSGVFQARPGGSGCVGGLVRLPAEVDGGTAGNRNGKDYDDERFNGF